MKQAGVMPGRTHLFEGNNMRAYSNMTTSEFVAQLRDIAIKAGARALVIDRIDAIVEGPTEDDIEEAAEEGREEGRYEGRKTQWEICFDMLKARLSDVDVTNEQQEDILMLMCNIQPE